MRFLTMRTHWLLGYLQNNHKVIHQNDQNSNVNPVENTIPLLNQLNQDKTRMNLTVGTWYIAIYTQKPHSQDALEILTKSQCWSVHYYLCRSKTNQLRKGVEVIRGKTQDSLGPVAAVYTFMAQRGTSQGPFLCFQLRTADKSKILGNCQSTPQGSRPAAGAVRGALLPDRSCHKFGTIQPGGLHNHDVGQVEQHSIPPVPQDTKGKFSISNCSSVSETYGTVVDNGIAISLLSHVYSYS